jgi:large subunit ribosomal protein L47
VSTFLPSGGQLSFDVGSFSSGRAWTAAELRRKSFRDLHTLWYVLVRERNLLATQKATYRRSTVGLGLLNNVEKRAHQVRLRGCVLSDPVLSCPDIFFSSLKCRKSMARMKYVINERRLAYEGAMKIHAEKMELAAKEKQKEVEKQRRDSADIIHQEQKVSPPVSEATQAAVDSLLQRSTT